MFYSVFIRTDTRILLPCDSHPRCKRTVSLHFSPSVPKRIAHRLSICHETAIFILENLDGIIV